MGQIISMNELCLSCLSDLSKVLYTYHRADRSTSQLEIIMGSLLQVMLALIAFPSAYFIYQVGTRTLMEAHLGYGTPEYTLMLLTVFAAVLVGLLGLLGLMKSPLIKYILPLLLATGAGIAWLKMTL